MFIHCPNIEDYDIVYGSTQMCIYCNENGMAIWMTKNPHQGIFLIRKWCHQLE